MRLLSGKEKGVPDAQAPKNLDMVSSSLVVRCGFHTRLERQWSRMVFDHSWTKLPRRLDATRSSMGYIQSPPRTVGAHWSYIVARPPRRRGLPVEVTTWSVSQVSGARLATRIAYARVCRPALHAPDAAPLGFAARLMRDSLACLNVSLA